MIFFFFRSILDLAECVAQSSDGHSSRPRRKHFNIIFFAQQQMDRQNFVFISHPIFGLWILQNANFSKETQFHFAWINIELISFFIFAHFDDACCMIQILFWIARPKQKQSNSGTSDHQIGFNRTTHTPYTSSFLLHTPPEALLSTISRPSRNLHHYTQTPASIIMKMRLNKHRTTTPMIITTTQLRGDQQPPIDDDNPDDIDEFIPLGVKNQPVTVLPKYFTNERDNTRRRIRIALSHNFLSLLSTLIFVIAFFFHSHLPFQIQR